jgi:lysozyme
MRKITQRGIDLIKKYEDFSPCPYSRPAGLLTIGYGHVILPEEEWQHVTEEEGEELLRADLAKAEHAVLRNIQVPLRDHQFDALVSFTFNLGGGALQRSTLRSKINNGDEDITSEFLRWIWCKGRKLAGLIARRREEAMLWEGAL